MSSVPSATAPSATPSTLWNNKNYFLLAGLTGLVLFIAYRYFPRTAPIDNRPPPPDLSQRLIATLFPDCANVKQKLPFDPASYGIIRIDPKYLSLIGAHRNPLIPIVIECLYKGKPSFSMPMSGLATAHACVSLPPKGEKIYLQFKYEDGICGGVDLTVDQEMGIYEIYIEDKAWKIDSHPEPLFKEVKRLSLTLRVDSPLSFSISSSELNPVHQRQVTQENYYFFQNTTQKVHILFFEIAERQSNEKLVVPMAIFPEETINLPQGFLRTCWGHTFFTIHGRKPTLGLNLDLLSIVDTAAPYGLDDL